jgi:hypothetical protein
MSTPTEVPICTQQDYNQILDELHAFWGERDTRHLHHPFLIHEFGNSAYSHARDLLMYQHSKFIWLERENALDTAYSWMQPITKR